MKKKFVFWWYYELLIYFAIINGSNQYKLIYLNNIIIFGHIIQLSF